MEVAAREVRDEMVVGRPERIRSFLGASQRRRLVGVDGADPEAIFPVLALREEGDQLPVGRDGQRSGVGLVQPECRLLGGGDRRLDDERRLRSLAQREDEEASRGDAPAPPQSTA